MPLLTSSPPLVGGRSESERLEGRFDWTTDTTRFEATQRGILETQIAYALRAMKTPHFFEFGIARTNDVGR